MKINYLLILILLFTAQNAIDAQAPTLTFGEGSSFYDDQPRNLIGETKTAVLSRVFLMENVKLFANDQAHQHGISYHDKVTLKRIAIKPYPMLKGKGVLKPEKATLQGEYINGDTLLVFYNLYDKETKISRLFGWPLNIETLQPLTPEATLISEGRDFDVTFFPENKSLFVSYFEYSKEEKATTVFLKRFDSGLDLQFEKKHTVKGSKYGAGIRKSIFTKKDELIVLIAYTKKKNPDIKDPVFFTVVAYPEDASRSIETEIELQGGHTVNCDFLETKSNKLIVFGNYTQVEEVKDEKDNFRAGSYAIELDPSDLSIVSTQEEEFTDAQKTNLYAISNNPNRPNSSRSLQANLLDLEDVVLFPEKNAFALLTSANVKVVTSSATSSRETFRSGSVAVTYIGEDAKILWQHVLPRSSFISGMALGLYPGAMKNGDKLYVMFNDVEKNIAVFKTAGKKGAKKPASKDAGALERFDMSPELTPEVYPWNLANTVYRITEFDNEGNMTVMFLNPEKLNKEEKSPLVNPRSIMRSEEGSYVMEEIEAGIMGPKNHGLIRVKF